jgi:hypothetical protein
MNNGTSLRSALAVIVLRAVPRRPLRASESREADLKASDFAALVSGRRLPGPLPLRKEPDEVTEPTLVNDLAVV